MTLCNRLIARLDIKGSRLIKGIRFEGLRVLGDPCEAATKYAQSGADELLYVDAVASLYGRNGLADLLRRTIRNVFIPITAGGGVRSVEDAAALLAAGADKIAVNTAALQRPELITDLAEAFGRQCVVVSIQARRTGVGRWEAMSETGRERSGQDALRWMEQAQHLGAGEILLTSVDQDGTCAGPDLDLLRAASTIANVPLVLGGGFSSSSNVLSAFQLPRVSAVSIGAALHRGKLNLALLKQDISSSESNVSIRPPVSVSTSSKDLLSHSLEGKKVGIIDYGMGNQQSLINAFEKLGAATVLSSIPEQFNDCDLLSLPGVGSFPEGMCQLKARGLDTFILKWVGEKRPLLGICLGMQMLFQSSDEFGSTSGLNLLKGNVKSFPHKNESGLPLLLPHVGWNRLYPGSYENHMNEFVQSDQYFVHSYIAMDVDSNHILFNSVYCQYKFVAAVKKDFVVGFQFHPERSGYEGLRLLSQVCLDLVS